MVILKKLLKLEYKKALKISQPTPLRQPKTIEKNPSNLAFISTLMQATQK